MRIRLFALIALGWVQTAGAGEPTATDLIKLIPSVASTDPNVKSIEMVGSLKTETGYLRFRAIYKAPDHYSLLLGDESDGTPLVYIADRQLLCYDPIRSSVLCLKDCSVAMALEQNGKLAHLIYGFGPEVKSANQTIQNPNRFKFDARTVCEKPYKANRVVNTGESGYRLFLGRDQESTMVCSFDTSKPHPFNGFKVFFNSSHEPFIRVDKLVVDGPLSDDDFQFPDRKTLAKKIPVHELVGHGFVPPETEIAKITTAMQVRLALTHPGSRDSFKGPLFDHLDWKTLAKNDKKCSAVLRDLVPVERKKASPNSSVAAQEKVTR